MAEQLDVSGLSEAGRIARFMGLPKWRTMDDMSLVDRVRDGFPASTASIVFQRIDPEGKFMRPTDAIPRSTLHRRKDLLTRDESERIWALSRVFAETLRIYHDDKNRAVRFLVESHPMLADRSPIALAKDSIAGADLVLKLLAKADAGVAA